MPSLIIECRRVVADHETPPLVASRSPGVSPGAFRGAGPSGSSSRRSSPSRDIISSRGNLSREIGRRLAVAARLLPKSSPLNGKGR